MKAEFIKPQNPKWKLFLTRSPHDFYHLPEYSTFAAKHEEGNPIAFYTETQNAAFLMPLLIRKVPARLCVYGDCYDATTSYGYPTPIMVPSDDLSSLECFLEAFRYLGARSGIISAFFRLHPLLPLSYTVMAKYGTLVNHGQTVYVDLSLTFEQIWAGIRKGHRADIRKLVQSGFKVKMDDWDLFEEFLTVYKDSMRRLSAKEFYLFSDSYFRELRSTLGDRLHLSTVLAPEGEVAAAALFTVINGIVQYHFSGSSNEYLRQAPSKLMLQSVIRWAKETGSSVLHLGGGVGGHSDSLFSFKAGFSERRAEFYTYRMILDEDRYNALVQLWQEQYTGNSDDQNTHFFPLYRNV